MPLFPSQICHCFEFKRVLFEINSLYGFNSVSNCIERPNDELDSFKKKKNRLSTIHALCSVVLVRFF